MISSCQPFVRPFPSRLAGLFVNPLGNFLHVRFIQSESAEIFDLVFATRRAWNFQVSSTRAGRKTGPVLRSAL